MGLCLYVDLCFHPYLVGILCGMSSLHLFNIFEVVLPSLHLFICLSCSYCCNVSFLLTWLRKRAETTLLIAVCFKANLCITALYLHMHTLTYYSTMLDSCHIDFFVDMEVHEDFLMNPASTGTHLIFCFMCDRK